MKRRLWRLLVTIGVLAGVSTSGYAGDVHALTVGVQSPVTIVQGGSGTFLITLSRKNGGNAVPVNLVIAGLPAGTVGSFSPNNFSMNTGTTNATLTVTTSNSTPGGVTSFTVVDTHAHVSGAGTLTVGYLTTTAVSSSSNPAAYGLAVTLTATVSSSGGTPGGSVTFNDGAIILGTGTLNGSGQATFSTNTLSVAGSPHSISVVYASQGNFLSSTSSVLAQTITAAGLTCEIASSANPSLQGSNVNFAITLNAVLTGGGTPTGIVQLTVDGQPFGSPMMLGDGVASTGIVSLTHGQHTISAEYSGDGNFLGITNSLTPDQIINTPPVVVGDTLGAVQNASMNWATVKVLANDCDADGDLLSVTNVGATSAQGGAVLLSGTTIIYTPPADYIGPDSFTCIVADAFGGTGTGMVSVIVNSAASVESRVVRIEVEPTNSVTVTFSGIPGATYIVQGAINLVDQDWLSISTNEADPTGWFRIMDQECSGYPCRFYRSVVQ